MKKISSDLYIVEPNETVTINIEAVNTISLVTISLDGQAFALQPFAPFVFHASSEKGTTHDLMFLFTFSGPSGGAYHVILTGSEGGTDKFSVDSGDFGIPASSQTLRLRVGSAEIDGKLGIDPPSPWPHG
jgi:hypothetical protein